jgi:hypothetical protein
MGGVPLCVGRMLQGVFSLFVVFGTLFVAFYIEVIGKMLITYFLTAHSLIAFGMIYALDASFLFGVALGLAPFLGSLI